MNWELNSVSAAVDKLIWLNLPKHIVVAGQRGHRDMIGVQQGPLFTLDRLDRINLTKSNHTWTNQYFSHASSMATLVCGPPLWSTLKYISNHWMVTDFGYALTFPLAPP